jgi:hypothetical protein
MDTDNQTNQNAHTEANLALVAIARLLARQAAGSFSPAEETGSNPHRDPETNNEGKDNE